MQCIVAAHALAAHARHVRSSLGAAVVARAEAINQLWALMDERCTCRRFVKDHIHRVASCPPCANG
eukprot:1195651-Prymnesium_polylepis.1